MYSRLDLVCDASGAGVSEDVIGYTESDGVLALWVIDGSTGLADTKLIPGSLTDAGWYARQLSCALSRSFRDEQSELLRVVDEAIGSANHAFRTVVREEVPVRSLPSASLVCARIQRAAGQFSIEVAALGDCAGAVDADAMIHQIPTTLGLEFDQTFNHLAAERCRAVDARELQEVQRRIAEELRKRREMMNAADGYSIAAPNFRLGNVLVRRFTSETCPRILLCSDGAARLVEHYGRFTWNELLEQANQAGVQQLINELRSIERMDSDCVRFPRLKGRDDAAIVYARIA